MNNVRGGMGYNTPIQHYGYNSTQYPPSRPNPLPVPRGLGNTATNIPPVSQLEHLSRDQLILLLDSVEKLSNNA